MVASVEEVSSSLVREYLSRKGLKRTIACMDEEHPRTEASINNRSLLRQVLNIEDLYRKNKALNSPLKTLLEIIVKHHIERLKNTKPTSNENNPLQSSQTIRSLANSSPGQPTAMDSTETEEITPAFLISSQTKLRSDTKGSCPPQPVYMSQLPDKDRLSSHNERRCWAYDAEEKGQPLMASVHGNESFIQKEPEKNTSITETTQRVRTNRIRRGMMAAPMPQESNTKRQSRRVEGSPRLFSKEEESSHSGDEPLVPGLHKQSFKSSLTQIIPADCSRSKQKCLSAPERIQSENSFDKVGHNILKTREVKSQLHVAELDVSEMVLDDIDEDDDLPQISRVSLRRNLADHVYTSRPLDQHTVMELKSVLLGSSLNCFSVEWRNQGFAFSETHDLRYGIVQRKGGPCGVLASVQAFVLRKLLFENTESKHNTSLHSISMKLRPSNTTRRKCLVLAMAEILWRAGEEKQATVAICQTRLSHVRSHFTPTGHYKSQGVLEKLTCFTVDNMKDLQQLLEEHIEQFETGTLGCVLLTVSAVLSRSIEKVREDMDVPTTTLIGAHGYCTQELVNLLLCGRAVSNVFDNDMELDSGHSNMTLLKGIKDHCDVGLLSLFEHYNICKEPT
ncbi:probable ubiquitin carboxyl-terminal hydrolase MINDY-4 isoform X2 [Mugil cephalus]|uniref:probable ubiquitin carboxyl-terminal hydrolase MINDY-4 isoform X2 n=1 Tax=Mugil cephalus TaxID=48193 RepID=UPI001FB7AAC4|nr:probable ubiquitin carboxyl-terminal hydrolase MINDY-4 isoform X2 [Mugil cephalus]